MAFLWISLIALCWGLAVAISAKPLWRSQAWQRGRQGLLAWRLRQGTSLRALGALSVDQQLGWRPPLIGLGSGLALGALIDLWVLACVGLALGLAWPKLLEARLRGRRLLQLAEQLPGLFESLASALRSGQSLTQALASAVEDLPEPASLLMGEALRRVRLGEEAELALQAAGAALDDSPLRADWRMLGTAVAVVRGSGGKLPEILDQLAATVRERQRLQAQVRAQTAQAKLSAWVIGCLPPALLLAMQALDPELCAPLFHTATGGVILASAVGLEAAGVFLLRRLATVTV